MSRIPQPSRGTPRKTPASPANPPASRVRTKSTVAPRATTPHKAPRKAYADTDSFLDKPKVTQDGPSFKPLSIKEAIALKRAAAKKTQTSSVPSPLEDFSGLEDAIPNAPPPEEDDPLGRPALREIIERAKSTGTINLSTRLPPLLCIPSAIFELHLGITPEPLKSVPNEPPLPPALDTGRRKPAGPAWFEIQDLEVLKAWGNDIVEIQPEICLFGGLKSIDLHRNKISSLPEQFADLAALTTLDLSHNALKSLPKELFSLPALSNLNVSDNALTSLPFTAPFSSAKPRAASSSRGLFGPEMTRASAPLPKLVIFNASNNNLVASAIDLDIPNALITLDLSGNPLEAEGHAASSKLFKALAMLQKLKVLRCENTDVSDRAIEGVSLTPDAFPRISVLDFGLTKITENGASYAFKGLAQELTFEITNDDPPSGTARIIVGKKIVREAWELEAERRSKSRAGKVVDGATEWPSALPPSWATQQKPRFQASVVKAPKEAWEIQAEQGLLTEGGKRRARAAAAAAAVSATGSGAGIGAPPRQPSPVKTTSLTDPQYYTSRIETLTLPASTAPPKASGHARAFSLAATSLVKFPPPRASDVTLPTATMPLALIAAQPFSQTLKVLVLTNRRMDRSFTLPPLPVGKPLLPRLEDLSLEGCNLGDSISISTASPEETILVAPTQTRPILPLLSELFPSLRNLNMAYNALTSAALTTPVLSGLILSSAAADSAPAAAGAERKGLKQLHLRGNRITDLEGFQGIAVHFKGNREVPGWGLEELDLRDNEIGKLPSELGLLPLDIFLVDGNVFRVPARRVWEREGTKGLLSWLRGRIE